MARPTRQCTDLKERLLRRAASSVVLTCLTVVAALGAAQRLAAQNVTRVQSVVDPAVCVLGEDVLYGVVVELTLTGDEAPKAPAPPEPPASTEFDLTYRETRQGASSSFTSIVNGRVSQRQTMQLQYIFGLRPKSVGGMAVAAHTWKAFDKEYHVPAASFTVEREAPGNKFIAVEVTASTTTPYVNQPVKLRFAFKTKKLMVTKAAIALPWAASPNGFFAEPIPQPDQRQARSMREVALNGEPFTMRWTRGDDGPESETLVFERTVFPLAPGRTEIGGASISVQVGTRFRRDLFGNLQADDSVRAVGSTEPLVFEVRDAPTSGRPASYAGVIGDFKCEARYGKTTIRAGDGVTLTLSVSGPGDVDGLTPPPLVGFDGFDVSPPDRRVSKDGDDRTMTFSWFLVPKSADIRMAPRFEFAWFQPATATFQTAATGPVDLEITGEVRDEGVFGGVRSNSGVTEIRTLSEGIRPLKQHSSAFFAASPRVSLPLLATAALLPLASLLASTIFIDRRRRLHGDASLLRRRRASKSATKRLAEARALRGQTKDFWAKLARSLTGFIADKLSLPPASVSVATSEETLSGAGVDGALVAKVIAALGEFDALQFGGAAHHADQDAALRRIEGLVDELDRAIKG